MSAFAMVFFLRWLFRPPLAAGRQPEGRIFTGQVHGSSRETACGGRPLHLTRIRPVWRTFPAAGVPAPARKKPRQSRRTDRGDAHAQAPPGGLCTPSQHLMARRRAHPRWRPVHGIKSRPAKRRAIGDDPFRQDTIPPFYEASVAHANSGVAARNLYSVRRAPKLPAGNHDLGERRRDIFGVAMPALAEAERHARIAGAKLGEELGYSGIRRHQARNWPSADVLAGRGTTTVVDELGPIG